MKKALYSFRETLSFSKRIIELLSDDEFGEFQWLLVQVPESGDLMRGGGSVSQSSLFGKRQRKTRRGESDILFCSRRRRDIFTGNLYEKRKVGFNSPRTSRP